MRLMILSLTATMLFAQDAKVSAPKDAPASVAIPSERPLTDAEVKDFQLTMAQIALIRQEHDIDGYQEFLKMNLKDDLAQLLRKRFDIAGFETEIKGPSDRQVKNAQTICKSVGIPDDKIQSECELQVGVYPDGRPELGPDKKPIMPRVFWRKPIPVDVGK